MSAFGLEHLTKWIVTLQALAAFAAPPLPFGLFAFGFCAFGTSAAPLPLPSPHLGFVLLFWVATIAAFSSSSPS